MKPKVRYVRIPPVGYVLIPPMEGRGIRWNRGLLTVGVWAILAACVFFLWRTKSLLGLW